jgi:hypothetical protein
VPAEAGDDAVRRPVVLDLEHGPLVGLVRPVERLGHDPVEAGALEALEPLAGDVHVGRGPGDVHRRVGVRQGLEEALAPLAEGAAHQVLVAEGEDVEGDQGRRRLAAEQRDPARGRVDAQLQGLEVEPVAAGHDDLAVEHAALRRVGEHRLDDLGEVPRHRALVAGAEQHLVAVAEDDRAEAVPLRLDVADVGDLRHGLGEHRRDRRHHGQVHDGILHQPTDGAPPPGVCRWCRVGMAHGGRRGVSA